MELSSTLTVAANLSPLGQAALKYAHNGWAVFPCKPEGKQPITTKGFYEATTDTDQIVKWWTRNPDANIGFATGHGVYVLDVDGDSGQELLTCLELEHGALPTTREAVTGKGRHLYFSCEEKLSNSASGYLGASLDTRGDGGYVILPPSIHENGRAYEWINDCEPAPIPEWLKPPPKKVYTPPAPLADDEFMLRKTRPTGVNYSQGDNEHPYVVKTLDTEWHLLRRAVTGTRNSELNRLAFLCGRIANSGYGNETHMEQGTKSAALACGLEPKEVEKSWRSGFDAGFLSTPFHIDEKPSTSLEIYSNQKRLQKKTKPNAKALVMTPLSKVKKEHVQFLWGNRLVQDAVNILVGDGGLGKSAVALHIARSITDGVRLPDDHDQVVRGDVMLVTYEDPPFLVEMRAKVLGIDLDRMIVIEGQKDEDGSLIPFSQDDVHHLDATISESYPDAKMLIIDPWTRYLDEEDFADFVIRRALAPLEKLALKHHMVILVVAHINKRTEGSAIVRIAGSAGFKNAARSVLMIGKIGDRQTAVAHIKHNWSPPAPAVMYSWDKDKAWADGENPLEWSQEVLRIDPDDLFAKKPSSKTDECVAWLHRTLIDAGWVEKDEITMAAVDLEKFAPKILDAAFKKLGIVEEMDQFSHGGKTIWRLPDARDTKSGVVPSP